MNDNPLGLAIVMSIDCMSDLRSEFLGPSVRFLEIVSRCHEYPIGLLLFAAGAILVRARLQKAAAVQTLELSKPREPLEAAGLIAMVSKGDGSNTARDAIAYHAKSLRHLWLLIADKILAEVALSSPNIRLHPLELLSDPNDLEAALIRITDLRRQALKRERLRGEDLICDFTGLTKNASAGMVLASANRGARLQYMVSKRMDNRSRGVGDSRPVEVVISYAVAPDRAD
jgi:hypothetical protein